MTICIETEDTNNIRLNAFGKQMGGVLNMSICQPSNEKRQHTQLKAGDQKTNNMYKGEGSTKRNKGCKEKVSTKRNNWCKEEISTRRNNRDKKREVD